MGLFDNKFTRWLNRGKPIVKEKPRKKYMYIVSAEIRDDQKMMIDLKFKCPGNSKKEAIQYFDDNIHVHFKGAVRDRKKTNRKRNFESMQQK